MRAVAATGLLRTHQFAAVDAVADRASARTW